ncbi:hypothetical protein [Hymenobacter sp. HDW8]|uniref:hypothetical protein n=1 Tax=Hymenobacter sp. HDW8 TaxID=2714932 RepID=UPI00140D259D|nr:hypothetical protein [Hymenobacter sp. HDW8]QIL76181.1 hypothetical protein G7064_10180 [Hymenobacter sp. HDW8]
MKTVILRSCLLMAVTISLFSFEIPAGWFVAGSQPKKYEMGIEAGAGQTGKKAATIKSIDSNIDGFGTLMQASSAQQYLGKRVRLTGYIKSKDVKSWAGLWMRVDQAGSHKSLAFDNMSNRAVKGTTDWKKYEIVLDVPAQATNIAYGALLSSTGQIWFDNLSFEVVDASVPTTDLRQMTAMPTNLNFEE